MRIALLSVPLLALSLGMLGADEARQRPEPEVKTACHGTAVEFIGSPVEAAKQAAKQKKLVMVLHVSGHFEDPDFT
jgi:hypothetical protein